MMVFFDVTIMLVNLEVGLKQKFIRFRKIYAIFAKNLAKTKIFAKNIRNFRKKLRENKIFAKIFFFAKITYTFRKTEKFSRK
jgi:hypothetical protein